TERGSTCSEFIYSLRWDHAARRCHRRASLGTGQPLSEIAYACGFRDYTHFARKFRRRFGYPPGKTGVHSVGAETVRAGTGESAPWAHDSHPPTIYLLHDPPSPCADWPTHRWMECSEDGKS